MKKTWIGTLQTASSKRRHGRVRVMREAVALVILIACLGGCNPNQRSQFIDLGTAPPGGAFFPVGSAIADVLNEHRGEQPWRVQAKGSGGSMENIRRLSSGEFQLAMSNAAISYFSLNSEAGWEKSYEVRTVVTMAPNVALFLTKTDSGIRQMSDLKGKRVVIGPPGAGFEMFVRPIVEEHGLAWEDLTVLNAEQSRGVDMLADGAADAVFLGGAIPTASIQQACNNLDIHFIPFDSGVRQRLADKYPFFELATIPQFTERDGKQEPTYRGMTEDFSGLDVGRMHLITYSTVDEELIYQLTKTIWNQREQIAERHPAGRAINEKNAARMTGVPFHPGAERFYKEIGIWPTGN
ncbi:MAG TPA: TAXI family TRAP transporter solute-binding subunit [Pirellulaceae bacterium]|nr:TAXI family TRAP transporter solute-binding subunit [Pirellulaceae bacterium]